MNHRGNCGETKLTLDVPPEPPSPVLVGDGVLFVDDGEDVVVVDMLAGDQVVDRTTLIITGASAKQVPRSSHD